MSFIVLTLVAALVALVWDSPNPSLAGGVQIDVDRTDNVLATACTNAPNDCSLAGAITRANADTAADLIYFDLGGGIHTFTLSPLPAITQPVAINGSTGGASRVVLSGAIAGAGADGLRVNSSNVILNGLVIKGFGGDGIEVFGNIASVIMFDMRIGVNETATAVSGNGGHGVFVNDGPDSVTISISIIGGNTGDGVRVAGLGSATNTIKSSLIGIGPGNQDLGNADDGIEINDSTGNTIGGSDSDDRNIVSNNGQHGISVVSASGTSIRGNYIGTNIAGTAAAGNENAGISISEASASNDIGGTGNLLQGTGCAGDCNLISGNGDTFGHGVQVNESINTDITGNFIGTNVTGDAAMPNKSSGVDVTQSQGTRVGNQDFRQGNLISGNSRNGVAIRGSGANSNSVVGNFIGTDLNADFAIPNQRSGVFVAAPDNAVTANLISGNIGWGIRISNDAITSGDPIAVPSGSIPVQPDGNSLSGNYIGLSGDQTVAIPNTDGGIEVVGAVNTIIGGTRLQATNVISGNGGPGIAIRDESQGTIVLGNRIGINFLGLDVAVIANTDDGVLIEDSSASLIGTEDFGGNIISGNWLAGVHITGQSSSNNTIAGNFIGTGPSGLTDVGNGEAGIQVEDASGTTIGGDFDETRNVISGNELGISIKGATAVATVISGNFIGTNSRGDAAIGNDLQGIVLDNGVPGAIIGGDDEGEGNVISGNKIGMTLDDDIIGAVVQGNFIGTDATGEAPLGNTFTGIEVHQASDSLIGGTGDAANVIAFNGHVGIQVDAQPTGINIWGNSIYANDELGIDLREPGGIQFALTQNDLGDPDIGGNDLQNYPILTSVTSGGGGSSIQGSLNSRPGRQYRLDFFLNDECDPDGNGEGQTFLGSITVNTNNAGNSGFLASANTAFATGAQVTATATDLTANNTSEFSACETVVQGIPVTPTPTPPGQTATPTPTATTSAQTPTATVSSPASATPTPTASGAGDQRIWGDMDCDGEVSSRDNQALLRAVLEQPPLSQTEPCPNLDDVVTVDGDPHPWGDADCDGEISSRDNQALLRAVLEQTPLSQTEPCPSLGDQVLVT